MKVIDNGIEVIIEDDKGYRIKVTEHPFGLKVDNEGQKPHWLYLRGRDTILFSDASYREPFDGFEPIWPKK